MPVGMVDRVLSCPVPVTSWREKQQMVLVVQASSESSDPLLLFIITMSMIQV